jgi:AcrR family transcriptional regulator
MQQRSEETRQNLIAAALGLFAQDGYDATSVAQICQAAGVSKGAFYHHFSTKQELFLELLGMWMGQIDAKLEETTDAMQNVPHGLLQMAESTRDVLRLADGRLPMFLEFWSQARLEPAVWQATIEPYRRYQAYFTKLIEQGIAEGSIREIDPAVAARLLVSLAVGFLLQCVLDPQGEDWARVLGQSVQLLLDGLARRG